MSKRSRKKLFVDYQVQGAILSRIVIYWVFCFLFVSLSMLLVTTLSNPDVPFWHHLVPLCQRFWPAFLAMTCIVPFVVYDALKVSNRFCGPLSRVVSELDRFNKSGEFDGVQFRDDDFWQPLSEAVTQVVDRAKKANA